MKTILLYLLIFYSILSYSQINLVTDGGLENWDSTTSLVDWTIENDVSQNTTDFTEGISSASLKIVGGSNLSPKIKTHVPLESGITYTVRYKHKYVTASFEGSHSVCIKLDKPGSATSTTACAIPHDNLWATSEITFTPDQTGDYNLSIATSNFFGSNSFEVLVDDVKVFDPLSVSINNPNIKDSFIIYPTITDGQIYFDIIEQKENYKILIFDINGRKYMPKIESNSIDLSFLKSGIYFINYSTEEKNITKRIIKR